MLKTLFSLILMTTALISHALNYTVSFDKVKSHYVTVHIDFEAKGKDVVNFKVPVWTPGSYKVREFSNAFENVAAEGMDVKLMNKNTWQIKTNGLKKGRLSYDVYCFTVSVRQSYADEYYAFLHGVSAFGYLEGYEKESISLKVIPRDGWGNVEVSLPKAEGLTHTFSCTNYDLLADSPIAAGNFETTEYTSGNVPHKVVMIGEGNYDLEVIKKDFKSISDEQVKMMGDHPSPQYIHFIYNVANGGGGLEHLNCQTSMMKRWNYTSAGAYRSFLGLIAHEYFHLWNVKRVRAIELGPFNYDSENYTDMLWIAEGITSYYDDRFLYRIGKYDEKEYLNIVASNINRLENTPGKDVMSLAHSSILAWVKAYMPNEESMNRTVSYYNKGMVAAFLLDLEIRANSDNRLDEVMTTLYQRFYKEKNRGFTHEEFIAVCSELAGKDMQSFFDNVIFSAEPIDYAKILSKFGMELKNEKADQVKAWSGVISSHSGSKTTINNVYSNSPAVEAGLSVNDEIIAIDGWRVDSKLEDLDSKHSVGDKVEIVYARDGKMYTTSLVYTQNMQVNYAIVREENANALLVKWLKD